MNNKVDYGLLAARIVKNYARRHMAFTSADLRDRFETAEVPPTYWPAGMRRAITEGWIAQTDEYRRVPRRNSSSTDDLRVYESLWYKPR